MNMGLISQAVAGVDTKMKYLRLSHSSVKTYDSCPRKLEFTKFYPRAPKIEYWDTMVGKALHAGYQEFLISSDPDKATWAFLKTFNLTVHSYKDNEPKDIQACYATLEALMDYKAGQLLTKVAEIEVNGVLKPAIEVPFQLNLLLNGAPYEILPGVPVIYVGFMDDIVVDFTSDTYIVEDLKTTRRTSEYAEAEFKHDEQAIPYGLVLNAALKRPITNFTVRYVRAYVDLVAPEIQPLEFTKSTALISDWALGLLTRLEEIKRFANMGWFRRDSSACMSWNKPCGFYDLCDSRDGGYIRTQLGLVQGASMADERIDPWFTIDLDLAGV